MSGSETGVVINMQQKSQLNNNSSNNNNSTSTPSQPVIHNMHLEYAADGTAVYRPVAGNGNGNAAEGECMNINMGIGMGMGMGMSMGMGMGGGDPVKRKRGRPRKYGADGSMAVPPSSAPPPPFSQPPPAQQQPPAHHQQLPAQQQQQQQQPQQQLPVGGGGGGSGSPPPTVKKARGRPPGSSKKQQVEYLGSLGIGFTPHVITVKAGEDVASRIMSFSQNGPRAICILSANGAISHVTLRQAATSGGSVTYEGRFEILSLSGSFMLSDTEGQRSRTGGLSVSLAGPDGRVLGGGVAGLLTAASPVQVVVGSFIADSRKEVNIAHQTEPFSAPSRHTGIGATGASSPTSRGTLSESSGGPGSPLNQNTGAVNSTPPGMSGLPWK